MSRSHFYEIKQAYESFGKEGLGPKVHRKPRMPNQIPPELERQILAMTEQYPTYSSCAWPTSSSWWASGCRLPPSATSGSDKG